MLRIVGARCAGVAVLVLALGCGNDEGDGGGTESTGGVATGGTPTGATSGTSTTGGVGTGGASTTPPGMTCFPGQGQACPAGCLGFRYCVADGSGYTECDCGQGTGGATGGGPATGGVGVAGAAGSG